MSAPSIETSVRLSIQVDFNFITEDEVSIAYVLDAPHPIPKVLFANAMDRIKQDMLEDTEFDANMPVAEA